MASKFRNSGQTCVCANRFFVHESVHDEFLDKFSAAIETLNVGDGSADGVTQGPLINGAALDKIDGLVAGAVASGAVVHLGGRRSDAGANFFEPTLLSGVTDSMVVAKDEIFGPGECKVVEYRHAALLEFLSFSNAPVGGAVVAAVLSFKDDAEVVERANNTPAGLAAYLYTTDLRRVWRISEALQFGMVGVNTGMISSEVAPFGGVKESGFGREGSKYGLSEYLDTKYIGIDIGQPR